MKQNAIMTGITNAASAAWIPPTVTFASPPQSPLSGTLYLFTDASSSGANSGGGSSLSQCVWSGSGWVATSGSGGTGGAVSSVFGRTGAVVANAGDYTAAQVTNAVDSSQTYANPSWISSLAYSKITGAPAPVTPGGANQNIQFNNSGAFGGSPYLLWDNSGYILTVGKTSQAASIVVNGSAGTSNLSLIVQSTYAQPSQFTFSAGDPNTYGSLFTFNKSTAGSSGFSIGNTTPASGVPTDDMIIGVKYQSNATVERMRFQGSTGNLGIGTSSPGYKIDIAGDCNLSSGSVYRVNGVPINLGLWTAGSGGAIYYNGGPVGIGISSPTTRLQVSDGSNHSLMLIPGSTNAIQSMNDAGSAWVPMNILAPANLCLNPTGGLVGIGTTSPQSYLQVTADATRQMYLTGATVPTNQMRLGFDASNNTGVVEMLQSGGSWPLLLNPSGGNVGIGVISPGYLLTLASDSAAKPGTSTWTIASDVRVKRNIKDLYGGLDVINRLRPVDAEYNGMAGTPPGGRAVGFLAHEVATVLPQCVTSRPETGIQDLNIHEILIHLILAVQQLAEKN